MPRVPIVVLVAVTLAGPALVGTAGMVGSIPVVIAAVADLNWPPWIGNLANVVQILGGVVGVLAWRSTRRRRE
jgi:hypothetical protein